jgi:ABC-2 type transport system permease protein
MVVNTLQAWWLIAKNKFQTQLLTPSGSVLFIVGKIFNLFFSVMIIFAIFTTTKTIQGYTFSQAIVVVLIYNFIESVTQFFFRAIYTFRPILVSGEFDLDLLRPLPSFFRPLLSGPDFLDFPLIIIEIVALIIYSFRLSLHFTLIQILTFILYLIMSLMVTFFLLLAIAAFSILTTEVDNLVWIQRSFMRAGTVPTDIYRGVFRFILDYLVPVTFIVTVPAKALLGLLNLQIIIYSLILTVVFGLFSWNFWRWSLRHYASTGS